MPSIHFKGKAFLKNYHQTVKFHHLIPDKKNSVTKEPSLNDNLIIHGDNLKALKALLPTHAGKIKCIYIDPPYNTGKQNWIYNDNVNSPMIQKWLGKVVNKDDLTRHDKWCCMMYPRLSLLRELLKFDGVIFVSIDDNEVHHLKMIMDEIFGEENFVGNIIWKNVTDNNPTNVATEHEYIMVYAKSKINLEPIWKSKLSDMKDVLINIGNELIEKYENQDTLQKKYSEWFRDNKSQLGALDRYKYIDIGGVYTGSQSVHNPGKEGYRYDVIHPETQLPCKEPLMGYRFPEKTMNKLLEEGDIIFGNDHNKIIELKLYAKDYLEKLSSVEVLDGRLGAYDVRQLFPEFKKVFTNPKPVVLIEKYLSFILSESDIVLDSFAGSGTTAHAVLNLNAQDSGNRKFILIECEDYANNITAERVRRVIKGIPTAKDEKLINGLRCTFSFYTLGDAVDIDKILEGVDLPSYIDLAKYVFFTATGQNFIPENIKKNIFYIGTANGLEIFLMYEQDKEKLKKIALNLDFSEKINREFPDKKKLVFSPCTFLNEWNLREFNIDFVQLPFAIYRYAE